MPKAARIVLWRRLLQQMHWLLLLVLYAGAASAAGPAAADYRLGPGDLLKISAFGYPDLATDARVSQSGTITFPMVGSVTVAGMDTRSVEDMLAKRLSDGGFIKQAQVSVLVMEYQSQKVSVMGQVAKPGQYFLKNTTRLLDVLAEAGGVVNGIAGDQATLVRADGTRVSIDLPALFDGDPTQNPPVASGDTINVPRAPQFYIYGEVRQPGVYRLERNMTISRAITAGGGLTPKGSERRTVIKRRDSSGKERQLSASNYGMLQPDDVLYVKESLF